VYHGVGNRHGDLLPIGQLRGRIERGGLIGLGQHRQRHCGADGKRIRTRGLDHFGGTVRENLFARLKGFARDPSKYCERFTRIVRRKVW
jgi:hypothetical protein